jgi:hypothetical protein
MSTNRDLLRSLLTEADRETASRLQTLLDKPVSDLDNLKADIDFQKQFGMHTPAFQDLAANVILRARDYTDTAVREADGYVKNLMQEKHKLELDLADAKTETKHQKWSNTVPIPRWSFGDRPNDVRASQSEGFYEDPNGPWVQYKDIQYSNSVVQAAVIAGQADEIKRLAAMLRASQDETARFDGYHKSALAERDALKQENERLQKAHDHQYSMAGQMLREAERNGAERDDLKTQLEQALKDRQIDSEHHVRRNDTLAVACARAQGALRNAGFTLVEGHDGPTWEPTLATSSFHKLYFDACIEANRARGLFPKPDHLVLALAEEAGEVTKAVLDYRQKKIPLADVRKEIVQTMAMCLRLACEGDPTVALNRSQE